MTWYAAHIVEVLETRDDVPPEEFLAHENIVLIAASSVAEAMAKAEARGRADIPVDPSWTLGGRPARWVFVGVRHVVECDPPGEPPGDGTEVSYNTVYFESREDLARFAAGETVRVELEGLGGDGDAP